MEARPPESAPDALGRRRSRSPGSTRSMRCIRALCMTAVALLATAPGLVVAAEASAADHPIAHHGRSAAHANRGKRAKHTVHPVRALAPRIPHRQSGPQPALSELGARGRIALAFALAQIGKPYVYGGTGPYGYDCSGLAQTAWAAAGLWIPRTTQEQAGIGTHVPMNQLRPGDLVLFYADASHVGIYVGGGNVVVAPHRGARVMIQQMRWMPVYDVRRPG